MVAGTTAAPEAGTATAGDSLEHRLLEVLRFAERTVVGADPEHALWRVDLGRVSGFDKLLLEASVLALLVDRGEREGATAQAVDALIGAVARRCDRPALVTTLRRHPELVTTLGITLLILERFGRLTDEESRVLRDALDSPYVESVERTPFRLLDRVWVLGLAGRGSPDASIALRLSTASRRTHPLYMEREDVYAITHAVMYATDFGRVAPPRLLLAEQLWRSVDACLAWCLAARDFDLVAELLLTQLLLRQQLSTYGGIAFRVALRTWDELGFVPGPSLSADDFRALDEDGERRQYALYHMYHTVFVSGLVLDAVLRVRPEEEATSGSEETEWLDPPVGARDVPADLVALLERWDGAGDERTLERLALDALVIRHGRSADLDRLATTLEAAVQRRVTTETVLAGADFLRRHLAEPLPLAQPW